MTRLANVGFAKFFLAASCIAFSIGIAQAGDRVSDEAMLDMCIQRFIASNLAGYQGKIEVHKERHDFSMPLSAGASRVVVSAAGANGKELESAVCHVDRDGEAVSLTPISDSTKLSMAKSVKPAAKSVVVAEAASH